MSLCDVHFKSRAHVSVSKLYQASTQPPPDQPLPAQSLRRRLLLLPAWVLPAGLILAFAGLFALVFRERLVPALAVNATPAILLADIEREKEPSTGEPSKAAHEGHMPADSQKEPSVDADKQKPAQQKAPGGAMLFQAGGWFEPDPLPIYAIGLTDGVISSVHVLEGQLVKKGQLLAELIADDAKIALSAAQRAHERTEAEQHLQEVQVSVAEAEASAMGDQVKAAEAKLAEERDNQSRLARIPEGSVSDQERSRARFVVEAQEAEVAARKSQHAAAVAKVEAAKAQAKVLKASVAAAHVEVEKHSLALSRTRITSPVDGVILELHAAPGQKKLLGMDDHQSATIATLFETGKLQARVDVPLADARGLTTGQEAVITSDFLPNTEFRGVVSRIVGAANLQRNTLQAKVRVMDPDPRLRPEMLCRVKFMEGAKTGSPGDPSPAGLPAAPDRSDASRAVMVPEQAVIQEGESRAMLWVVARDGVSASRREIKTGTFKREGHVAVASGVLPGELVILPPHHELSEGRRVRPTLISP